MRFVFALSGMLPALLAMYYVDRLDAVRPEPRWQLRKIAIFGGLSTLPCIFIEGWLQKGFAVNEAVPTGALFTAFITAATTEECAKALVVWLFIWRHPAFDERMDGIVYATRAGLGFALVENVGYLLGAKSVGGFAGIYIARALLAVPGHAIWAAFMGYYAARKKFDGKGPGILGGLAIAIFSHGASGAETMTFTGPRGTSRNSKWPLSSEMVSRSPAVTLAPARGARVPRSTRRPSKFTTDTPASMEMGASTTSGRKKNS